MPLLEFSCQLQYPSGFRVEAAFDTEAPVTALCGPSGSGKTSILSMIAGLRRPDTGLIRVGPRLLFDSTACIDLPSERRRVGYVFQDHLIFPHLNVHNNLLYGWRRRAREARAVDFDRVAQVLELGDLLERRPHSLSGGQRQRVALGRALLCGPDLLLFDEPLSSVDDELKQRVLEYMRRVVQEWRIPTLYVTHNLAETMQIADWVVRLEQGRVLAAGRPDDIFAGGAGLSGQVRRQ
jgi:molybdate transport system ATP-binding protein